MHGEKTKAIFPIFIILLIWTDAKSSDTDWHRFVSFFSHRTILYYPYRFLIAISLYHYRYIMSRVFSDSLGEEVITFLRLVKYLFLISFLFDSVSGQNILRETLSLALSQY